jgi:E3 ubiquitin-protein ligase RAD18
MTLDEPISDSTDWLPTPLSTLAPLESSLRCQVCKDFFNTPMITSCSHTFCSLCIRRYLSQEGRCPACRQNDTESKLRRNWVVEELVANFKTSRKSLLDFARQAIETEEDVAAQRPRKRRKVEADLSARQMPARSTRSQARKDAVRSSQESLRPDEEIADSESEYEDEPERSAHFSEPVPRQVSEPDDGLIACPGCGRRMKAEAVFTHLDTCASSTGDKSPPQSTTTLASIAYTQPSATNQKERLPTLAYSMLNDNALRKKLKELGISNQGPKLLMQKRHTEWVNLWNANSDSRTPRLKRELLKELEVWERTQGRQIANNLGASGVMAKDFDSDAYAKSNKSDFDELIRKAREKAKAKKADRIEKQPGIPTPNGVDAASQVTANTDVHAEPASTMLDIVPESPVNNTNGYVDRTSPLKPATQEGQLQSSQPPNITT